eukprot:gene8133-11011_t
MEIFFKPDMFLESLLNNYGSFLKNEYLPFLDNAEYMKLTELRLLVKNIREISDSQLFQTYSKVDSIASTTFTNDANNTMIRRTMHFDRTQLIQQIAEADKLLLQLNDYINNKLELSRNNNSVPRIVQLCEKYKFSKGESEIFHLMTVIQGSNDSHVLNTMIEEDYLRKISGFQRVSGMSEMDIDIFCDSERQHMKESIVMVDEENGTQFNLRIQRVAVQLLYGRKVKADDIMKIAQTCLEEILNKESSFQDDIMIKSNNNSNNEPTLLTSPNNSTSVHSSKKNKRKRSSHIEYSKKNQKKLTNNFVSGIKNDIQLLLAQYLPNDSSNNNNENNNSDEKTNIISALLTAISNNSQLLTGQDNDNSEDYDDDQYDEGEEYSDNEDDDDESYDSKESDKDNLDNSIPLVRSKSWGPDSDKKLLHVSTPKTKLKKNSRSLIRTLSGHSSSTMKPSASSEITNKIHPISHLLGGDMSNVTIKIDSDNINNNQANLMDNSNLFLEDDNGNSLKPYDTTTNNQLEYLEDSFQIIALMIKSNVARLKDDMKKEGTSSRYSSGWGDNTDMKQSKRELSAKLRLQETKVQMRLKKTFEMGYQLPRLELITSRFHLDSFERKIVLLLIGKTVSPVVKTLMDTLDVSNRTAEDVLTVGQALSILCQDFHSQISHRKYFYQSSTLLKNAVISLSKSKWHVGTGDLTENRIILDRRILDWVVGLDSEINELVEGSDLYEPQATLSQVVLPTGYSEAILSQCASYDEYLLYKQKIGLQKTISYGNSLVILLYGKSGTGKTMTVNAIAHELKKKVLLVDFNSLVNKKDSGGGGDLEVDLKGLFRESKMSNAVLFFDECEIIFKSRNLGSDRLLNALLTEIERHEGIVFMATNRPYEIDEAMHRRITMVLEYREPDYTMRKQIWDNLLGINSNHSNTTVMIEDKSYDKLSLADDVDTSILAIRYELTGGFIKNAVLSSLLSALSRDKSNPIISQADLINGAPSISSLRENFDTYSDLLSTTYFILFDLSVPLDRMYHLTEDNAMKITTMKCLSLYLETIFLEVGIDNQRVVKSGIISVLPSFVVCNVYHVWDSSYDQHNLFKKHAAQEFVSSVLCITLPLHQIHVSCVFPFII